MTGLTPRHHLSDRDPPRGASSDLRRRAHRRGRRTRAHAQARLPAAADPAGPARVAVDPETGTVVWPGGADLAPDTLYERVRTGIWPDENVAA
jgi:hypothetical protein